MRNRDSGRSSATYCHQDDAPDETADSEDEEHDAGPLERGVALGIKDLATTEQRVLEGRLVLRGRGQADTADEDADHPGDEDEHAEATVFRWRKIEAPARRSVNRHPERAGRTPASAPVLPGECGLECAEGRPATALTRRRSECRTARRSARPSAPDCRRWGMRDAPRPRYPTRRSTTADRVG